MQIFLQSDNTAVLQAALEFKASSPMLVSLAADISLQIEHSEWEPLWGRHLRGIYNTVADSLSRKFEGASLLEILKDVKEITKASL